MHMAKHLRMAAYCRVSTKKEAQLDSLIHQKEFFTEYAQKEGMLLTAVYADEGVSGRQMRHREQFLTMLEDAKHGQFDVLAVKDVSRFARNTVDCLQAIRLLKRQGIGIRFISAGQETLGESEFILTVYASLAQEESANLSKRIRFGKEINAKKGRVPPLLYGYDRLDLFHLRINMEEAEVIRQIFSWYLEGEGTTAIARQLNRQGSRTKKGKQWDSRGIRRCLQNSMYCGILINHKTVVTDFLEGTVAMLPENEQYFHMRPEWAIVSPDQFRAVQAERQRRRQIAGKACGINRNTGPAAAVSEDC